MQKKGNNHCTFATGVYRPDTRQKLERISGKPERPTWFGMRCSIVGRSWDSGLGNLVP